MHQPEATAEALAAYLERRPEYAPGDSGRRVFLTTGAPGLQHDLAEAFWRAPLRFDPA